MTRSETSPLELRARSVGAISWPYNSAGFGIGGTSSASGSTGYRTLRLQVASGGFALKSVEFLHVDAAQQGAEAEPADS